MNVNLKYDYNTGTLAHEIMHAYQFEMLMVSFSQTGFLGGALYDAPYEIEAYARGQMYVNPLNPSMSWVMANHGFGEDRKLQIARDTAHPITGVIAGTQLKTQVR